MATADEHITSAPPADPAGVTADPGRIPLAPIPTTPAVVPEGHRGRVRFLDGLLVLLVLAFAFLCGSFRATNSDLYLNLATGRLIAQGGHTFGTDPFTFTAQGTWVNHSWLYGLVSYLIYSVGDWGGAALVVLKALTVLATAWLMLRAGSLPGQRQWIPAVCTMLAVLALSPRLLLQPAVVSMLLLAATLYILTRPVPSRLGWLLPVLCAVWVNIDAWFILGPVTILLYLLGEAIQSLQLPADAPKPDLKRLALLLGLSVLACLANPHHVQAFTTLPVGLLRTGEMSQFLRENAFRSFFLSPFESGYLMNPNIGLSAAGLAFYPLLAIGVLSFLLVAMLDFDAWRWWRVCLFLVFASLAGWNARAIPFFAVVAAPVMALNFLDLTVKLLGADLRADPAYRRWAVSGRVLSMIVMAGFIAACLPGWLQAQPHHRRMVGWGVETDPGLKNAALTLARWQQDGAVPADVRYFNTTAEVVNYFAWFCPKAKGFVDGRLELFSGVPKDLRSAREALSGEDRPAEGQDGPAVPAWRRLFAERDVSFVVFYSDDLAARAAALGTLSRLYSNPAEFVPCFVEGGAALFAWVPPAGGKASPAPAEDFNKLAFGANPVQAPDAQTRGAGEGDWWWKLLEPRPPTPPETMTAVQHMTRFDALAGKYRFEVEQIYLSQLAGLLAGQSGGPGGPVAGGALLPARWGLTYNRLFTQPTEKPVEMDVLARHLMNQAMLRQDRGPVASLYLGVRAARAALAKSPDDVYAQLYLAQAYNRFTTQTRERSRVLTPTQRGDVPLVPHVTLIRQTQVAGALQNSLKAEPRPEQARATHMLLMQAFAQPEYFELHVEHVKKVREFYRKLGPGPIPANQFKEMLGQMDEQIKGFDRELKQRRDQYEVQSANKSVLEKARIAMERGLADTALNLLINSTDKDLRDPNNPTETPGLMLMLNLLLGLGRLEEARNLLIGDPTAATKPNFGMHPLGVPAYQWFQVQLGAATGDYETADQALKECIDGMQKTPLYAIRAAALDIVPTSFAGQESTALELSGLVLGQSLLLEAQKARGLPWNWMTVAPYRVHPPHAEKIPGGPALLAQYNEFIWQVREQEADLWAVRGWLAVEAGRLDRARECASKALALAEIGKTADGKGVSVQFRSRPLTFLVQHLAENKNLRP